jgi:hypothetical protein
MEFVKSFIFCPLCGPIALQLATANLKFCDAALPSLQRFKKCLLSYCGLTLLAVRLLQLVIEHLELIESGVANAQRLAMLIADVTENLRFDRNLLNLSQIA